MMNKHYAQWYELDHRTINHRTINLPVGMFDASKDPVIIIAIFYVLA